MSESPSPVWRWLSGWADSDPDRPCVADASGGRPLTYGETAALAGRLSGVLAEAGLRPGDELSVVVGNSLEFCLLFLAALSRGIVFNPYPSDLKAEEVLRDVEAIGPAAVCVPDARRAEFERSTRRKLLTIGFGPGGLIDRLASPAQPPRAVPGSAAAPTPVAQDAPACIYHSAGGIGDARGVICTHANIGALVPSVCRHMRLGRDDRHLIVLPMGHPAAISYSLLPALHSGASVVVAPDFWTIRRRFWSSVSDSGITYVQTVPAILAMLLALPIPEPMPPSLRYVACGSARLPISLQMAFQDAFGIPVANLYGLAETGPTHADYPLAPGWRAGTIGVPLDVNEVLVVDEEGRPVADGETGELAIRGPNVFPGYRINPERGLACFRNGYFRTGDLGWRDADGRFRFAGCLKPIFIRGGINIHRSEIEEVVCRHPAVEAVTTESIPDDILGERIRCVVRLRPESGATTGDLFAHCREHLSPVRVPDEIEFAAAPSEGHLSRLPRMPRGV